MIMNRHIAKTLVSALIICGTSCTANFEDINRNPYEVTDQEMERDGYNIRAKLLDMQGWVVPVDVNQFQFINCLLGGSFGGYLSDSGSWEKRLSIYNPTADWIQPAFNEIIPRIHTNYTKLKATTKDPIPLAVAQVIQVAAIHQVTDIYGPIPYIQIGKDGKLTAPYDSQSDIYAYLLDELDQAIALLTERRTDAIPVNADKVFAGNLEKWVKFANSLKLRLAMRMVYANPELAQIKAQEAVKHEIGPMSSNADNAFMTAAKSPFYVVMYEYNGGDSRISADITSYMNGYNDPRRTAYFTQSTFDGSLTNGFHGLRSGIQNPESGKEYSNMNISKEENRLLWMNAAETAFLKAEGALRGWEMGDTPENLYNKGIILSFEQWGVTDVENYMINQNLTPQTYRDPRGTYSYTGTTSAITIKYDATADFETNLERIITQKWIANFPLGLEAWAEFRRTGYPKLMEVPYNQSGGVVDSKRMARRLPYPETEYSENNANYQLALQLLGGADNMATSVWWDCKSVK